MHSDVNTYAHIHTYNKGDRLTDKELDTETQRYDEKEENGEHFNALESWNHQHATTNNVHCFTFINDLNTG